MAEPLKELSMSPTSLEQYIEQSATDYVDELISRTVKKLQEETICRSCQKFISATADECPQCEQLLDQFVSQTMFRVKREFCPKCSQRTRTTDWTYKFNDDYKIQDFKWGTIEEFNVSLGKKLIEEYVKTWEYDASWLFCIDFLRREEFEFDTHYRYQVRWSIPTRCKPIPRATASIFFTFLLSKVKPKNYPVEVFYVLETNRLIHRQFKDITGRTNESRFREEWLKDIIESKTLLISSVDF